MLQRNILITKIWTLGSLSESDDSPALRTNSQNLGNYLDSVLPPELTVPQIFHILSSLAENYAGFSELVYSPDFSLSPTDISEYLNDNLEPDLNEFFYPENPSLAALGLDLKNYSGL